MQPRVNDHTAGYFSRWSWLFPKEVKIGGVNKVCEKKKKKKDAEAINERVYIIMMRKALLDKSSLNGSALLDSTVLNVDWYLSILKCIDQLTLFSSQCKYLHIVPAFF